MEEPWRSHVACPPRDRDAVLDIVGSTLPGRLSTVRGTVVVPVRAQTDHRLRSAGLQYGAMYDHVSSISQVSRVCCEALIYAYSSPRPPSDPSFPYLLQHHSSSSLPVSKKVKNSRATARETQEKLTAIHPTMAPTSTRSASISSSSTSSSKSQASEMKKKFSCNFADCGKSFSRSEHLHRHALNHKDGTNTCMRCSAHFRRRDLLGG